MKRLVLACFLVFSQIIQAQQNFGVADNENITWTGDESKFTFSDETLALNDADFDSPATLTATNVSADSIAKWTFTATMKFAPSTSNYARFFLAADEDLANGVCVYLGKNICIESVASSKYTKLVTSTATITSSSSNVIEVNVARTITDDDDYLYTLTFSCDGTEETLTASIDGLSHDGFATMGINCVYTKTRADKMSFSDLSVETGFEPIEPTPTLTNIYRGAVVINEIMPINSDAYGLPDAEYIELLNVADTAVDLTNWTISNGKTTGKLPSFTLMPDSLVVLVGSTRATAFASAVDADIISPSSWPTLTNSSCNLILSTSDGLTVDAISYSRDIFGSTTKYDGGYSVERIDGTNLSNKTTNWSPSEAEVGGTPGAVNSVAAANPDTDEPTATIALSADSLTFTFTFDEPLDTTTIGGPLSIDGEAVASALANLDTIWLNSFDIVLESPFANDNRYALSFAQTIKDLAGNAAADTFYYGSAPVIPTPTLTNIYRGAVVINEIMPINSDAYGLPDAEYIELLNVADTAVDLTNWTISNGKTTGKLPSFTLMPDSLVVLVGSTRATAFASAVDADIISPSSWPTLTNSSCNLILSTSDGLTVDAISYSRDIFGSTTKYDGGYSVERIDGTNLSNKTTNWSPSEAEVGGTPGAVNSVAAANPDTDEPEMLYISVSDDGLTLTIGFDEPMDTAFVVNSFNISGVATSVVRTSIDSTMLQTFSYELASPMEERQVYTVRIPAFTDLAGNAVDVDEIRLGIPEEPAEGDVIINEVMFNGSPSSNDYVELYNLSDKIIDLSKLCFGVVSDGVLKSCLPISSSKRSYFPGDYLVISPDSTSIDESFGPLDLSLLASVSGMNTMSESATIALTSTTGTILESLTYKASMLGYAAQTSSNVSLERIRFDLPTDQTTNWTAASVEYNYATPTAENSQHRDGSETPSTHLEIANKVFTPDGDGMNDELIIRTQFSDGTWLATVRIYSSAGVLVATPYNNEAVAVSGELTWNGKTDDGSQLSPGTYIVFVSAWQPNDGKTYDFKKTCVVSTTPH